MRADNVCDLVVASSMASEAVAHGISPSRVPVLNPVSGVCQAQIPCLKDNYAYLIWNTQTQRAAVVDPSEAAPVVSALKSVGQGLGQLPKSPVSLRYILNTHHHWDHTGGNSELKRAYDAQVRRTAG